MKGLQDFDPVSVAGERDDPESLRRFLMIFFCCILAVFGVLCFCEVDVVVTAAGEIAPTGGTINLVSGVPGYIKSIQVKNGDARYKGDVLFEIDSRELVSSKEIALFELKDFGKQLSLYDLIHKELSFEKIGSQLELSEVRSLLDRLDEVARDKDLEGVADYFIDIRGRLYAAYELAKRLRAEHQASLTQIAQFETLLAINTTRYALIKDAYVKGLISRLQLLEFEEGRAKLLKDIEEEKSRLSIQKRSMGVQNAKLQGLINALRRNAKEKVRETEISIKMASENISSLDIKISRCILRSPTDGVVQDVKVFRPGGYISSEEVLARIVPVEDALLVDALIDNEDIAFVRPGGVAKVKVDAYPYTSFGVLSGAIDIVASDGTSDGAKKSYKIRVSIDPQNSGANFPKLIPGMAVKVDIVTRKRRLYQYFMSPIEDVLQKAFTE